MFHYRPWAISSGGNIASESMYEYDTNFLIKVYTMVLQTVTNMMLTTVVHLGHVVPGKILV